jgi:hypothetical protein
VEGDPRDSLVVGVAPVREEVVAPLADRDRRPKSARPMRRVRCSGPRGPPFRKWDVVSFMGRAGIEPATLGLKVRPERRRRSVANGNLLQRPRFDDVTSCDELPVVETDAYSFVLSQRVERPLVRGRSRTPRDRLKVRAKTLHEGGNRFSITVRSIGKLIDSHPSGSRRNPGIARVKVLMEVVNAEADDGDVDTLCSLGAQAEGD